MIAPIDSEQTTLSGPGEGKELLALFAEIYFLGLLSHNKTRIPCYCYFPRTLASCKSGLGFNFPLKFRIVSFCRNIVTRDNLLIVMNMTQ